MDDPVMRQLGEWGSRITAYRFPRWEELPEIDFYMDQIIAFTEKRLAVFQTDGSGKLITPSIVNNYVKLKIIPPPIKKRYSRDHIAYLFMICSLKSVMPIPVIRDMIAYHLATRSLPDIYNDFCTEQEAASRLAFEKANSEYDAVLREEGDAGQSLGIVAVRMAVYANAEKMTAEKLAALMRSTTDDARDGKTGKPDKTEKSERPAKAEKSDKTE